MMDKYSDLEFRDATEEEKELIIKLWMEEFNNYFEYHYFNAYFVFVNLLYFIISFGFLFLIFMYSFCRDIIMWNNIKKGNFKVCLVLAKNKRQVIRINRRKRIGNIIYENIMKIITGREEVKRNPIYIVDIYNEDKVLIKKRIQFPYKCLNFFAGIVYFNGEYFLGKGRVINEKDFFYEALLIKCDNYKEPLLILLPKVADRVR